MKYRKLGRTGLKVSQLCLGSMTWGTQNSEPQAFKQIDFAVGEGINFIDTAEMYPTTPAGEQTQGRTEEIIGNWLQQRRAREKVIIATKISGKGLMWIRSGAEISTQTIVEAVDGSLSRLKTDYIDLYQLHWPNRGSYHFRQLWGYDATSQNREQTRDSIKDVLEALSSLVKAGKVRHVGLSNESCWGTMQFLEIAQTHGLPRVASIQNEYSLMQRIFDTDWAELSHNEDIGLLAYSPLAAGMLSGKYQGDKTPDGSRRSINETLHGRYSNHSEAIVAKYLAIAHAHGLDPAQMALAFCLTRPFMTSVIIGATTMAQLKNNIGASPIQLTETVLESIKHVHHEHPIPF